MSDCSPSKRRRIDSSSSESSADKHSSVSGSCHTSSLSPTSIIERAQPLSFFLTNVDGIESKFNQSHALGIRGNVSYYNCCNDNCGSFSSKLLHWLIFCCVATFDSSNSEDILVACSYSVCAPYYCCGC